MTTVPPALFAAAHPDDETFMGVAVAEHLAAGQDVHVVLVTDGEASGVLDYLNGGRLSTWWQVMHVPSAECYSPLTRDELAAARVREAANALDCLASGLPGTLTLHRAQLPDGLVTVDAAQAAILAVCDEIAPGGPVRIKGHTWISQLDSHPDHIAVGAALKNLSAADPVRFSDRRHYILPGYWTDPDLPLAVGRSWDNPTNADIAGRARNAARAYGAWAPDRDSYAIGMHSINAWFDTIIATPKCMVHP